MSFGTRLWTTNGLDGINIIDNTVPCCHKCNQSKSNFTLEEFNKWIIDVYNTTIMNKNNLLI